MVKVHPGFSIGGRKVAKDTQVTVKSSKGTTTVTPSGSGSSSGSGGSRSAAQIIEEARAKGLTLEELGQLAAKEEQAQTVEQELAKENVVSIKRGAEQKPLFEGAAVAMGVSESRPRFTPVASGTTVLGYRDIEAGQTVNVPTKQLRTLHAATTPPPTPQVDSVVGRIDSPQEARIAAIKERESRLQETKDWVYKKTRLEKQEKSAYIPTHLVGTGFSSTEAFKGVVRWPVEFASMVPVVGGRIGMATEAAYRADWTALGFGSKGQAKETAKEVYTEAKSGLDPRKPENLANIAAIGVGTYAFGRSLSLKRSTGVKASEVNIVQEGTVYGATGRSASSTRVIDVTRRPTDTGLTIEAGRALVGEQKTGVDVLKGEIKILGKKGAVKGKGSVAGTPEVTQAFLKFKKADVRITRRGDTVTTDYFKPGTDKLIRTKRTKAEPPPEPEIEYTTRTSRPIDAPDVKVRVDLRSGVGEKATSQVKGFRVIDTKTDIYAVDRAAQFDTATAFKEVTRFYPDRYTVDIRRARIKYSTDPTYKPNVMKSDILRTGKDIQQVDQVRIEPTLYRVTDTKARQYYKDTVRSQRKPLTATTRRIQESSLMRSKKGGLRMDSGLKSEYKTVLFPERNTSGLFKTGGRPGIRTIDILRSLETPTLKPAVTLGAVQTARGTRTAVTPTQRTKTSLSQVATPRVRTDALPITTDVITPTLKTDTFITTKTTPDIFTPTVPISGGSFYDAPPSTPYRPNIPPPPPVLLPGLWFPGGKPKKALLSKQPKKYTPSYAALGFGIKRPRKKIKTKGLLGLGIRPIPL